MSILNKINILLAKLTKEQYAPYKEFYENMKDEYDKRYEEIFGVGNNRLYLEDTIEIDASKYSADLFGKDFFRFFTFLSDNLPNYYFKNIYLDVLHNRIYCKDGREFKLTKFLQMVADKKIKNVTDKEYDYILSAYRVKELASYYASTLLPPKSVFDNDKIKLSVVISKNPYDIAGMSTDRRWTSCMELPNDNNSDGGCYHKHLEYDIKLGTLVAYLILPNDKNIENPYARIAIKPYKNIKNESVILYSEPRIYNDNSLDEKIYEKFHSIVEKFLNKIQKNTNGIFITYNELYNDSASFYKIKGHQYIKNILNINGILDLDKSGKRIISNIMVNPLSNDNKTYIDKFNELILICSKYGFMLLDDDKTYINPALQTLDNYYNKNITTEDDNTISIEDIVNYYTTNIKANNDEKYTDNKLSEKRLNEILNEFKDIYEWLKNHKLNLDKVSSYDMYIVDNTKYNINKDNSEITRFDSGLSTVPYPPSGYFPENFKNTHSIYIVNAKDELKNYIFKMDLSVDINLDRLINDNRLLKEHPRLKLTKLDDYMEFSFDYCYFDNNFISKLGKGNSAKIDLYMTHTNMEAIISLILSKCVEKKYMKSYVVNNIA